MKETRLFCHFHEPHHLHRTPCIRQRRFLVTIPTASAFRIASLAAVVQWRQWQTNYLCISKILISFLPLWRPQAVDSFERIVLHEHSPQPTNTRCTTISPQPTASDVKIKCNVLKTEDLLSSPTLEIGANVCLHLDSWSTLSPTPSTSFACGPILWTVSHVN